MSKHHLRKDMTCLNCSSVVEKRYCPNCGQENTDTRKTFHHLFVHFFEDLTHYENAFWKTIRNLMFRPGALTKEYLSGKRMSYLAPVRLYIFISFVTFFLLGVLPEKEWEESETVTKTEFVTEPENETEGVFESDISFKRKDRDTKAFTDSIQKATKLDNGLTIGDYSSLKQFDSVQNSLPANKRAQGISRWFQRKLAEVNGRYTREEFQKKFTEATIHNIPKALFLYMPFFAFFIWLFHNKKRWYYFDSGIFTLHYFSFMLVTFSIYLMLNSVTSYINESLNETIGLLFVVMMAWWFFYFFRSHSTFYGERKAISRLKSLALFVINVFFLLFFMVGLIIYTALYMH